MIRECSFGPANTKALLMYRKVYRKFSTILSNNNLITTTFFFTELKHLIKLVIDFVLKCVSIWCLFALPFVSFKLSEVNEQLNVERASSNPIWTGIGNIMKLLPERKMQLNKFYYENRTVTSRVAYALAIEIQLMYFLNSFNAYGTYIVKWAVYT